MKNEINPMSTVALVSGALTLAGAGALAYFGGKAALITAGTVGGCLFAGAVTYTAGCKVIDGAVEIASKMKAKAEERARNRPADLRREVQPAAAGA